MRNLILISLLAVAGCAAPGAMAGNEAFVSVKNVWNEQEALPKADAHCHQFGKVARFNRMEGSRATFDCVKPS